MIIIAGVLLNPETVNVGQSFLVQVNIMELGDDFIRYCGTFYSGQDYAF